MGFFLFLFLFVLILVFVIVGSLLNFFVRLFSFGRKRHSASKSQENEADSTRSGKKVFGKEEGEYVDFEEIKE